MSNNLRPTKRSRLPRQPDSSDSPEAGPSTGVDTYQGSEIGQLPGTLDSSSYHMNSAVLDNISDHESSGTYNAQPGATSNPALDSKATCLTGHAYPLIIGPPNAHEYEQQQHHHSPPERMMSSMREQQHVRHTEYPQLFLDSRSQHNLDVHAATSPSLPTTNSSLGSPGPSSQAFVSGRRAEGTSGRRSHKRKATDEDSDEGALIPPQAPSDPCYQPMLGQVYVPTASLGQRRAPPSAYLPPYGIFPGAPALVPDVSGSSGLMPSFAMYPSQPAYNLPASGIQAPTHSAPLPADFPALGGLRRSPRLARHAEGDEISENDGSPPQSAASGSAPPTTRSERDKSNRKRNAQKQRDKKVDNFLVLNDLLEDFRVVRDIANDNKRKNLTWTPQQQILTNAIAYVQKVRNQVTLQRNEANAKLEQAEARCAQELANARSLWNTAEEYRLELEAEQKRGKTLENEKEGMKQELIQLRRKVSDAERSNDSALPSGT